MSVLTGKQAREARQKLALSQANVSKEAGIGRTFLSQFENERLDLDVSTRQKLKDFYQNQGYDFEPLNDDVFDPALVMQDHQDVMEGAISELEEMEEGVIVDNFELSELLASQVEMAKAMTQGFIADNGDFVLFRGHLVMKGLLKDRRDEVEDLISELNEDLRILTNFYKSDREEQIESGFLRDFEPAISGMVFAAFSKMMALRGACILGHCSLIRSVAGDPVAGNEFIRAAKRHAGKDELVSERLGFNVA